MNLTVNSDQSLSNAIGELREAFKAHKFLRVAVKTGKARSIDQNAISHAWYEQIANELREDTPLVVKAFCKLTMGVPILRAEDSQYREVYDSSIKTLPYEKKLIAMQSWPVTSLMTKAQLSQYLEAMQSAYAERGVHLEFPQEAA